MSSRAALAVILLLLTAACEQSPERVRTPPYAIDTTAAPPPPQGRFVNVFLVETQPEDDRAADERIGCGDRLVPIAIRAHPDSDDLTGALRVLVAQRDTLGLENVLNQNGAVSLDSVVTQGETSRVFLSGQIVLRGVCDHPRLAHQLQATARSASTADSIAFFINGETLEQWMSLR